MNFQKIIKKFLYPPIWVMLLLTIISAVGLTFVFIKGLDTSPIAYIIYILAFYTLSAVCIFFATVFPGKYRKIKQKIYDNPIGNRYMTDAVFRTHISLYASLGINLFYVCVNAISFVLYRSFWFVVLSGYYIILAVMRFLLLRYVRGNEIGENLLGELKRSRLCAVILLTVNFVLSGAVLMILFQNRGFEYNGILIYVMAGYTFYITTHAIINLIKYRKYNSPIMITTKVISLSAALVSMLSLETAMFSQFGADMTPEKQRLMIALTGAGVSITVIAMSVYIIVKSAREIKKLRSNI